MSNYTLADFPVKYLGLLCYEILWWLREERICLQCGRSGFHAMLCLIYNSIINIYNIIITLSAFFPMLDLWIVCFSPQITHNCHHYQFLPPISIMQLLHIIKCSMSGNPLLSLLIKNYGESLMGSTESQ